MAAIEVRSDDLIVTLTPLERVAALRREVRVPLTCVARVCADAAPWSALRGFRVAGTGIPGFVAYGVRLVNGDCRDFAALHGREPAVRIELTDDAPYRRLLVSVPDAAATVAALRQRLTAVRAG